MSLQLVVPSTLRLTLCLGVDCCFALDISLIDIRIRQHCLLKKIEIDTLEIK